MRSFKSGRNIQNSNNNNQSSSRNNDTTTTSPTTTTAATSKRRIQRRLLRNVQTSINKKHNVSNNNNDNDISAINNINGEKKSTNKTKTTTCFYFFRKFVIVFIIFGIIIYFVLFVWMTLQTFQMTTTATTTTTTTTATEQNKNKESNNYNDIVKLNPTTITKYNNNNNNFNNNQQQNSEHSIITTTTTTISNNNASSSSYFTGSSQKYYQETIAKLKLQNQQFNMINNNNNNINNNNNNDNEDDDNTIAIASTITGCGPDPFTEGAAVLKYSIELTSANYYNASSSSFASSSSSSGGVGSSGGGKYNYKFYILYHPDALECVLPLYELGFILLERPTPINVSDIRGEILRERIVSNGCCGERELIKLEAYRLIQHKVVIHIDLDVLVLQPMDSIIDFMLLSSSSSSSTTLSKNDNNYGQKDATTVTATTTTTTIDDILSRVPIMYPEKVKEQLLQNNNNNNNINDIQLLFTKDYNVVAPKRKDKPFQGGFFVIKPNLDTYQEMINIVLEGDYRDDGRQRGWGGIVGPFHGGMTIQGLLPWYYEYLHPGLAVELNRCVYNNIADNPTTERSVNDIPMGRCRTNQEKCEDCRARNISEIVVFHYCTCFKPWTCVPHKQNIIQMRLCRQAHHAWFQYRSSLEKSWGRSGKGPGTLDVEHFLGYCNATFSKGYIPIEHPYGK